MRRVSTDRLPRHLLDEFAAGMTLTGLHCVNTSSTVRSVVCRHLQSALTSCFRRTTTCYAASPTNSHQSALSSVDCNRCVCGLTPSATLPVTTVVVLNIATDGHAMRLTRMPTSPPAVTSTILSNQKKEELLVRARSDRRQFTDQALEVADNVVAARQMNG